MYQYVLDWYYNTTGESDTLPHKVEKDEKCTNMSPHLAEVMLTKHGLKHIIVPERQRHWPCTNPLFIELRSRFTK